MIRRPPRSTLSSSSAASDVYKRQVYWLLGVFAVAQRLPRLAWAIRVLPLRLCWLLVGAGRPTARDEPRATYPFPSLPNLWGRRSCSRANNGHETGPQILNTYDLRSQLIKPTFLYSRPTSLEAVCRWIERPPERNKAGRVKVLMSWMQRDDIRFSST